MQEKTLEEEFNEKFNNINIAVVTIESTEGTVSQQPAQDRLLSFISSREEKAREEGRKEGYLEGSFVNGTSDETLNKLKQETITQYKEELLDRFKHKFNGFGGTLGFTLSDIKKLL